MHIYIVYIYALVGILMMTFDINIPAWYISLVLFFNFKWIFDYRKCTISYMECLIRGVKKEQGYLYNFLDGIINIRYTKHIDLFYILTISVLTYHYFYKKNPFIPNELK